MDIIHSCIKTAMEVNSFSKPFIDTTKSIAFINLGSTNFQYGNHKAFHNSQGTIICLLIDDTLLLLTVLIAAFSAAS